MVAVLMRQYRGGWELIIEQAFELPQPDALYKAYYSRSMPNDDAMRSRQPWWFAYQGKLLLRTLDGKTVITRLSGGLHHPNRGQTNAFDALTGNVLAELRKQAARDARLADETRWYSADIRTEVEPDVIQLIQDKLTTYVDALGVNGLVFYQDETNKMDDRSPENRN